MKFKRIGAGFDALFATIAQVPTCYHFYELASTRLEQAHRGVPGGDQRDLQRSAPHHAELRKHLGEVFRKLAQQKEAESKRGT